MRYKAIVIKSQTQVGGVAAILIWMPFLFGTLISFMTVHYAVRYVLDFVWAMLLALMGVQRMRNNRKRTSVIAIWILVFLIYTAMVYIVQYQSAFYYLWGLRNNFRFFVAFFAFTAFLKADDIKGLFKFFDIVFWINLAVSLYQFFALELSGDYLGGIFGVEKGTNAYTNIFFVIMFTKDIIFYLEKKVKISTCVLKSIAMLLIAALAELKFFFVEFVLIIAFASLFTNFTWRKILVILGGAVAVVTFAALLGTLFPIFKGFLSLDYFFETGLSDNGYTSSGDLNRLNAIAKINQYWLKTPWQRLFGLGLGNCDTANFAFLETPFYESYGTMHYTWISYAMMYLECGWIGLIFYFGFFVLLYIFMRRMEKRSTGIAASYCRMGRILALMCMLIAIYNSSLRTEAGYIMYFALSVPFVMCKNRNGAAGRGIQK